MKLKALIVDDDPTVIFLHKIIVVESGFSADPEAFFSGDQTLDYLRKGAEADAFIVFLDINLAGMSGWEFLELVDELDLSVPLYVVMVTSSIHSVDKKKAKVYGRVIGFLEKPVREEDLHGLKTLDELKGYF